MDKIKTYESVVGALGFCLEEARADAERLEEELMDEAIVQAAHPLYVELLRAQARIDALSEAIELIMNSLKRGLKRVRPCRPEATVREQE